MFFLFLVLLVQLKWHCVLPDTCSDKWHSTEHIFFLQPCQFVDVILYEVLVEWLSGDTEK